MCECTDQSLCAENEKANKTKNVRGMSGKVLKQLRNNTINEATGKGLTQKELAEAVGVTERTLSSLEQYNARTKCEKDDANRNEEKISSPRLDNVLKIIEYLKPDISELIDLLSLDYLKNRRIQVEYQATAAQTTPVPYHQLMHKMLTVFEGKRYCFYYHTNESTPLQKLIMSEKLTYGEDDLLHAPATARGKNKYKYACIVTRTFNFQLAFFDFMSQDEEIGDSVHFVLPVHDRVDEEKGYVAGIGTVAHISYPSGAKAQRNPCFQLMAIVSDELAFAIGRKNLNIDERRITSMPRDVIISKGWEVIGNYIYSNKLLHLPRFNDEYIASFSYDGIYARSKSFFDRLIKLSQ